MTERSGELVQPLPDAVDRPRLVLAGLGHSHLFVLEAARQGRLPACDLVVCTGEARHVYSGMVPGWLAGQYTIDELSIDVAAAVRAAGGTLLPAHVTGIDPRARTLTLADGSTVPYDVCSIAVGSQVSGKAIPGVAEHAVAVKPLAAIRTIGERLDALARSGGGEVVVVGGGMAGVELALAIRARANGAAPRGAPAGTLEGAGGGQSVRVSLVSRDTVLASDRHPRVSQRLERVCEARGIELRLATTPVQLDAGRITLQHAGEQQRRRADLVVWATGGEAASWLAASGLPVDARGFLLVDDRLQSVGDPRVFAAGDSASLASWPDTPKAGVYAVRMGPRLVLALAHALGDGARPDAYRPQQRFLALANAGDGTALASWGGLVAQGRWAMRWKDWLDRRFMRRFAPPVGVRHSP
ncbi:MAG: FAD-dependent oxidoreductase [Gemmatimonadetes bacterium]|nr:FAD-dependent oxidoreductase [Gemmatimonadota bacterium]